MEVHPDQFFLRRGQETWDSVDTVLDRSAGRPSLVSTRSSPAGRTSSHSLLVRGVFLPRIVQSRTLHAQDVFFKQPQPVRDRLLCELRFAVDDPDGVLAAGVVLSQEQLSGQTNIRSGA